MATIGVSLLFPQCIWRPFFKTSVLLKKQADVVREVTKEGDGGENYERTEGVP